MNNPFSKFENFGAIADKKTRIALAKAIFDGLKRPSETGIALSDAETENFSTAINQILSNKTLSELCKNDAILTETITLEILDFITKTKRNLSLNDPFSEEQEVFLELNDLTETQAKSMDLNPFFDKIKAFNPDLNVDFYEKEFADSLELTDKIEIEWSIEPKKDVYTEGSNLELKIKNSELKMPQNDAYTEGSNLELKIKNSEFKMPQNDAYTEGSNLELKIKNSELKMPQNDAYTEGSNFLKNAARFESVKESFVDKWRVLLLKKQAAFDIKRMGEQRSAFSDDLYKRVEDLKALQEVLRPITHELGRFWDMSKGNWQHVNFDVLKQYADLLKRDKSLANLAKMLGKMQDAERDLEEEMFANAPIKTAFQTVHARKEDLVGIHESDDLSSLLPSETAFLSDSVLETVFFKKYVEKKLQTFDYQSKTPIKADKNFKQKQPKTKERGPFIVCVDTSGSMQGAPETVAKTLCFALLKLAIKENRKCFLISFSTQIETLNLTDFKHSIEALLSFLSMSFQGGTDAVPALNEALKQLETADYKNADVLIISDFVMPHLDENTQQLLQKAKENQTKFHSLVIGSRHLNKNIASDFDNNWHYDPHNQKGMITLVKNLKQLKK
jgi:uncharacterized protein with von Willebrand factor type A (vWA) domain